LEIDRVWGRDARGRVFLKWLRIGCRCPVLDACVWRSVCELAGCEVASFAAV